MLNDIIKFFKIAKNSGYKIAVSDALSYLGLYYNSQNGIKFRDIRINFSCEIKQLLPDSTILPHPVGIVISPTAEIGENVRIYQNVTIGWTLGDENETAAKIEDDVIIYAGATIIGDITIGEGAVVGANAVVLDDVEPGSTVVGIPAKKVQ